MTWRSSLELFDSARRLGVTFQIIGPERLRIDGPPKAMRELDAAFDQHAAGLVAIAEEFATVSAPVAAAEAILLDLCGSQPSRPTGGALQAHKGGKA